MAVRRIILMGNPILLETAEPIEDVNHPDLTLLVADMVASMNEAGGLGIAAPQIGVSKQVVVYHPPIPSDDGEDDERGELSEDYRVLINPELTLHGEADVLGFEGCLSVPGLMGEVARHNAVHLKALDQEGNVITQEVTGFHARILQHECDHLDGIVYPMRMDDMSRLVYVSEVTAKEESEDGQEE